MKIYEFHEWYMKQSADERQMFGLWVKPIDFVGEGDKVLWMEFKDVYEVYHHDALDISLISAWVLMLIQRCRKESYFHVGFVDPLLVNQNILEKERIGAICEGLVGFLVDKVINLEGEFYYDGRSVDAPSNTTTGGS
uniref:Uncharacterized protein n=1 Tax=Setaria viridis TaxID=4556 RepID=A0A4U6WB43_SETVI|nr:hypothetical protein SEVIR_1G153100v2 [Setaria viridis]